ncbi:MAG: DUF3592 domain-containing protein, partial [Acidobacteriota bacterium]
RWRQSSGRRRRSKTRRRRGCRTRSRTRRRSAAARRSSSSCDRSRSWSSSGIYERPLIAAEYETAYGTHVAVGFSSDVVSPSFDAIDDYAIGDEVRCWYDNDWPERFFVVRGIDFGGLLIFGLASLGSLGLLFVAFRPRK